MDMATGYFLEQDAKNAFIYADKAAQIGKKIDTKIIQAQSLSALGDTQNGRKEQRVRLEAARKILEKHEAETSEVARKNLNR